MHGLANSQAKVYDRVLENVRKIVLARSKTKAPLDISITYLINNINNSPREVLKHINNFRDAGADLIRFTFPQIPRGYTAKESDPYVPSRRQVLKYMDELSPIIEKENGNSCQVLILDLDNTHDIEELPRTLPCFARFVFPSIGFDGWLSHCSESAAPHFRDLVIGNLQENDFWDVFYNYDVGDFKGHLQEAGKKMTTLSCKCDRKEHVVNSRIRQSGVFENVG